MSKRKNKGRAVNGVLLLDKPLHMSSNQALQKVKRLFNARKAGHTGSLDPLATGMLPICLGEATKISAFLLDADKTYRFSCRLGSRTTTADAEGEVIETCAFEQITRDDIEQVMPRFTGDIQQIPPMHSALKKDGQRLYELARKGEEVEREARSVHIFSLKMLDFRDGEIDMEVHCSKGTYVRTLAEDIGAALGSCAYVSSLQRLSVEPYGTGMVSMEQVESLAEQGFEQLDELLLPLDSGIQDWPAVVLDTDSAYYLKLGQPVQVARAPTSGFVRIYEDDTFLGVGIIQDNGLVAPKRMLAAS
jgi:tRNA pseudouridine55 synthase